VQLAHQGPAGSFLQRIEPQQSARSIGGPVEVALLGGQMDPPAEDGFLQLPVARPLGQKPIVEGRATDAEPIQKLAAAQLRCLLERLACAVLQEVLGLGHVHPDLASLDPDRLPIRPDRRAQSLPEAD